MKQSIPNDVSTEIDIIDSMQFWSSLMLFAFVFSLVILLIDYLLIILMLLLVGWSFAFSFILLFEAGLILFAGGMFGTFRTSVSITKLKELLLHEPPISKSAIRTASQSLITYSILGLIIFIYGLIIGYLGF